MKSTLIDDIDFGPIWAMSGLLNFYGQGWQYHKILNAMGINFNRVALVSKTTTLPARVGNMELKENLMPKELIPRSIYVNHRYMIGLNAISLSGPGAEVIARSSKLYNQPKPFQFSFMSVAATREERLKEFEQFLAIVISELQRRQSWTRFAIQINVTCPNTGHGNPETEEVMLMLDMCDELVNQYRIPIILKVSVETATENILTFGNHRNCAGICTSNTVRFGKLPEKIDWKKYFPNGSPLAKRNLPVPGEGGLSGAPLLPLVIQQIIELRRLGFTKHINGGGGILYADDVNKILEAGANTISIGSVAFLNPWAIPKIIERAWNIAA